MVGQLLIDQVELNFILTMLDHSGLEVVGNQQAGTILVYP
jgi:hypothetical protein